MTELKQTAVRPRKSGYLPSLDGWRAIAIIGVMMTHDRTWKVFGHSLHFVMGYGGYGVNLFFAISGFLITSRILEEEALVGHFHIKRFYIRRFFRIQPAQFVFLAAVALLGVTGALNQGMYFDTVGTWLSSLFLYINFLWRPSSPNVITGHFWTLAVEEHFYILLSLTLFFIKKRRDIVLLLLFAACALPMEILSVSTREAWYLPFYGSRATQWHLPPLLLSAFAAVIIRRPAVMQSVKHWLRPWVAFLGTLVIAIAAHTFDLWHTHRPIAPLRHLDAEFPLVSTYLFIFWILSTVFHPQSLTTRLLEWKPARLIGTFSYSLYLWHVVAFYLWIILFLKTGAPFADLMQNGIFSFIQEPLKYTFVLLFGIMSYYFVEKPFIRIGHRLAPAATTGRPELSDLPVENADPLPNASLPHTAQR
jgi:peptidoglycan/LPS O-acetylase OafA/YrhL